MPGVCRTSRFCVVLRLGLALGTFVLTAPATVGQDKQDPRRGRALEDLPFVPGQDFFERLFGAPAGDPDEVAQIEVSLAEEQQYGQRVWQAFEEDFRKRKIAVVTRGPEVEYLRKLVDVLQPRMANHRRYRSLRVVLADTDSTDAYSIPGGTLVMFRGMMELADSEAALAGVLGHELSHLDHGHQLLPVRRMKYARQKTGATGFDPATLFRQANVFMSGFLRPFRPEDESQADRDGVTWCYRSGYDPRALRVLFTRLKERDQLGQFAPAFLRSHPIPADRLAAVDALYTQLQQTEPRADLYRGHANLQRLIPMSERRFEAEKAE